MMLPFKTSSSNRRQLSRNNNNIITSFLSSSSSLSLYNNHNAYHHHHHHHHHKSQSLSQPPPLSMTMIVVSFLLLLLLLAHTTTNVDCWNWEQHISEDILDRFICLRAKGFFPHEQRCDHFYECRNNTIVNEGICRPGLRFDYRYRKKPRCIPLDQIDCRITQIDYNEFTNDNLLSNTYNNQQHQPIESTTGPSPVISSTSTPTTTTTTPTTTTSTTTTTPSPKIKPLSKYRHFTTITTHFASPFHGNNKFHSNNDVVDSRSIKPTTMPKPPTTSVTEISITTTTTTTTTTTDSTPIDQTINNNNNKDDNNVEQQPNDQFLNKKRKLLKKPLKLRRQRLQHDEIEDSNNTPIISSMINNNNNGSLSSVNHHQYQHHHQHHHHHHHHHHHRQQTPPPRLTEQILTRAISSLQSLDQSSKQQQSSSIHCPHPNGYYPDRNDCRKFYACDDGRAFLMSCPLGLAYDEMTGTCSWPDMVEGCRSEEMLRFNCPEPNENEILDYGDPRYPTSDCRKFVVCIQSEIHGVRTPRLLGCEEGLVFNPERRECDYPENVPACSNYYDGGPILPLGRSIHSSRRKKKNHFINH